MKIETDKISVEQYDGKKLSYFRFHFVTDEELGVFGNSRFEIAVEHLQEFRDYIDKLLKSL